MPGLARVEERVGCIRREVGGGHGLFAGGAGARAPHPACPSVRKGVGCAEAPRLSYLCAGGVTRGRPTLWLSSCWVEGALFIGRKGGGGTQGWSRAAALGEPQGAPPISEGVPVCAAHTVRAGLGGESVSEGRMGGCAAVGIGRGTVFIELI